MARETKADLEGIIERLKELNDTQFEKIQKLNDEIQELKNENTKNIQILNDEIQKLTTENNIYKERFMDELNLQDRLKNETERNEQLKKENKTHLKKRDLYEKTIQKLNNENGKIQRKIESLYGEAGCKDYEIQKLNDEILKLNDENACAEEIQKLKNEIQELKNETVNNVHELNIEKINVQKIKNERGAGRKPKINDELRKEIIEFKNAGYTYQQIAEKFNISIGSAYNITNKSK